MRVNPSLGGGFYESASLPLAAQACDNLYPEIPQGAALSDAALFAPSGIADAVSLNDGFSDNSNSGPKKITTFAGFPTVVTDFNAFRIQRNQDQSPNPDSYTVAAYNGIGSGDPIEVSFAANDEYFVTLKYSGASATGYYRDASTFARTQITDTDFTTTNGVPKRLAYVDGYWVATTSTDKIINSNVRDPATWNALDFGSSEDDPTGLVAPFVFDDQIYIFGNTKFTIFQNIGGNNFPFQKIPGSTQDVGLEGADLITQTADAFYFIGSGPQQAPAVWRSAGGVPERISTEAIEHIVQAASEQDFDTGFAWTYGQKSHVFVGFTVGDSTIVFDERTGRWHTRSTRQGGRPGAYRPAGFCRAWNMTFTVDARSPMVGRMDDTLYTEFGDEVSRQFVAPPLSYGSSPFSLPSVELTLQAGVGNSNDTNPVIEMSISEDGETWGPWSPREMGKVGERGRRCIWRRNGQFERYAYLRFRTTAPVNTKILKLECEVSR